jgi:hypothetical protein
VYISIRLDAVIYPRVARNKLVVYIRVYTRRTGNVIYLYTYNTMFAAWAGWLGGYRRGVHFGTREFYRELDATQRHFN